MLNRQVAVQVYESNDTPVSGTAFEHRWFESVVKLLQDVQDQKYDEAISIAKLVDVRSSLQWIQENLNEKLEATHRMTLKSLYSKNIQMITFVVHTKDYAKLTIVLDSLKSSMAPYYQR
jgi:hypothetical protein